MGLFAKWVSRFGFKSPVLGKLQAQFGYGNFGATPCIRQQVLDGKVILDLTLAGLVRTIQSIDGTIMPIYTIDGIVSRKDIMGGSILEVKNIKVFEREV